MKTGLGPTVDLPPATVETIEKTVGHKIVPTLLAQALVSLLGILAISLINNKSMADPSLFKQA